MKNDRLYVGNISWDADENTLRAAFSPYGNVKDVKIITDRETGRSRGFGFVTMGTDDEAQAAIEALNGTMLEGRALRVNVAEERKPRGGGGSYGGGNRDRGPRW